MGGSLTCGSHYYPINLRGLLICWALPVEYFALNASAVGGGAPTTDKASNHMGSDWRFLGDTGYSACTFAVNICQKQVLEAGYSPCLMTGRMIWSAQGTLRFCFKW